MDFAEDVRASLRALDGNGLSDGEVRVEIFKSSELEVSLNFSFNESERISYEFQWFFDRIWISGMRKIPRTSMLFAYLLTLMRKIAVKVEYGGGVADYIEAVNKAEGLGHFYFHHCHWGDHTFLGSLSVEFE